MDQDPSCTHKKTSNPLGNEHHVSRVSEWLQKAELSSWVLGLKSPFFPFQLPRCRPSYTILILVLRVSHVQWMLHLKRGLPSIQQQQREETFCRGSSFCREPRDGDGIEISIQRKGSSGLWRKDWTPCMLSPFCQKVKSREVLKFYIIFHIFFGQSIYWFCIYRLSNIWGIAQFSLF